MDTPGIRIRPIIDMSAHKNEYNEVFLEDVRIPADRLLGKEGEGWALCTTQLQTERVALSRPGAIWGHGPSARELVEGLAEVGALEDGAIRDEAAQIFVEGEILRLLAYRALSDRMNAKAPGPEGAIHKMLAAPHGQRVVDLAKRSQGARGMIAGEKPFPSQLAGDDPYDDWDYAFWFSPGRDAGRGHAGSAEERRRRTHARPATRSRFHGAAALGGSAAQARLGVRDELCPERRPSGVAPVSAHVPGEGDLAGPRAGARCHRRRRGLRRQLEQDRGDGLARHGDRRGL
ncbi:MAG: hypothetical protein GEV13_23420 [Rhodospirillales bacterium]|nr:hypothetical protein [Rhodospirillales bacterium]